MVMLGKDDPKLKSTTSTPFEATRGRSWGMRGPKRPVGDLRMHRREEGTIERDGFSVPQPLPKKLSRRLCVCKWPLEA